MGAAPEIVVHATEAELAHDVAARVAHRDTVHEALQKPA